MKTAEEIAKNWNIYFTREGEPQQDVINALIEFAELHVQKALEQAAEKAEVVGTPAFIDEDSILTAYPLNNIK